MRFHNTPAHFLAKVQKSGPDDCWLFLSTIGNHGYGVFNLDGKLWTSHRLAYTLEYGPIPPGKHVLHSCDDRYPPGDITYRQCCNPRHFWLGTQQENVADAKAKRRVAFGQRSGARTHPEQIVRGEQSVQAKLTEFQIQEIHALYVPRKLTQRTLALRFGVSQAAISFILNHKRWKHLPQVTHENLL